MALQIRHSRIAFGACACTLAVAASAIGTSSSYIKKLLAAAGAGTIPPVVIAVVVGGFLTVDFFPDPDLKRALMRLDCGIFALGGYI